MPCLASNKLSLFLFAHNVWNQVEPERSFPGPWAYGHELADSLRSKRPPSNLQSQSVTSDTQKNNICDPLPRFHHLLIAKPHKAFHTAQLTRVSYVSHLASSAPRTAMTSKAVKRQMSSIDTAHPCSTQVVLVLPAGQGKQVRLAPRTRSALYARPDRVLLFVHLRLTFRRSGDVLEQFLWVVWAYSAGWVVDQARKLCQQV